MKKINSLQALRAIAFLGIFSSHSGLTHLGAWGVSVFLILSGFLMTINYIYKSVESSFVNNLSFSIKKMKKLYLLHIFMLIAALFICFPIPDKLSLEELFLNVSLLQSWIPYSYVYFSLNAVSWYLSVCLFLYFAFPFLINRIKRYHSNNNAIISIIFTYIIQILIAFILYFVNASDEISKWVIYIWPLFRMGDYFIGCNLGYIFLNKSNVDEKCNLKISVLEIITIILVYLTENIYTNKIGFIGSECVRYSILFIPTSMALVYLFALNRGVVTRIATNKLLLFLGNISAFTFLIHQMVIRYYDYYINESDSFLSNNWIRALLCFVITIICSYLWMIIDKIIRDI